MPNVFQVQIARRFVFGDRETSLGDNGSLIDSSINLMYRHARFFFTFNNRPDGCVLPFVFWQE